MVADCLARFVDSRKYRDLLYTLVECGVEREMGMVIQVRWYLSMCVVGRES
jgi:hypothetical protein